METTSHHSETYRVPAECDPHDGCIMAWPVRTELWGDHLADAKADYAAVARAIAPFEQVFMVCLPGQEAEVERICDGMVTPVPIPINDSWTRDHGGVFVRDAQGGFVLVGFGFNAWGDRWHPHDDDARLAERLASHFGVRYAAAPFVLEGGSWYTDGKGTLFTTEQCLLNPNRNPTRTKQDLERLLGQWLGAERVVWLPFGHSTDVGPEGTDGHIDGVMHVPDSGRVLLEASSDERNREFAIQQANLARLRSELDRFGLSTEIVQFDPGPMPKVAYLNHYQANGAVIVPIAGDDHDEPALAQLRAIYPERKVVGVPGKIIMFGGGGPHCITQQIPVGALPRH